MKIEVTDLDINNGKVRDANECPVALALQRVIGAGVDKSVIISDTYGYYRYPHTTCWYLIDPLPKEVIDFIDKFDNCKPVWPISFEVEGKRMRN